MQRSADGKLTESAQHARALAVDEVWRRAPSRVRATTRKHAQSLVLAHAFVLATCSMRAIKGWARHTWCALWLTGLVLCVTRVQAQGQVPGGKPSAPQGANPAAPAASPTQPAPSAPTLAPAAEPAPTAPTAPTAPPASGGASAVDNTAALQTFLAGTRDALGRGCTLHELATQGPLRYAACGDAGVWIVRFDPGTGYALIARQDLHGDVDGFFARDGELWAQVTSRSAIPIARAGTAVAAPASGNTAAVPPVTRLPSSPPLPIGGVPMMSPPREREPAPRVHGEVIESGPGYVIVDFGSADLLADRSHIAFYQVTREPFGDFVSARRERLAVGVVDSVATSRARVRLGLNERVPEGALAELTEDSLTASQLAPPRLPGLWEIAFHARPFLVLGDLGTGLVLDARAGYRTEHFHVEGLLLPLALATASDGVTVPVLGFVTGAYDSRLFEIGLGLGGQTVNDTDLDLEPGTGATVVQRARLGSRDGLHLEAFTYLVLFHSEFEFSGLRLTGQIPVGRGGWLIVSGGGGSVGLGFGEIGLRALLAGNGDRDSMFVTVTVGGAEAFVDETCDDDFSFCETKIEYGGPTIGAGLEWRL